MLADEELQAAAALIIPSSFLSHFARHRKLQHNRLDIKRSLRVPDLEQSVLIVLSRNPTLYIIESSTPSRLYYLPGKVIIETFTTATLP